MYCYGLMNLIASFGFGSCAKFSRQLLWFPSGCDVVAGRCVLSATMTSINRGLVQLYLFDYWFFGSKQYQVRWSTMTRKVLCGLLLLAFLVAALNNIEICSAGNRYAYLNAKYRQEA
mmetsp:Transcript_19663/g.30233  ORF Transcript_19663/g.30233 Transcript_19663/m.30233 type:complete len:117 (-) Transcript_19663:34-384(-)